MPRPQVEQGTFYPVGSLQGKQLEGLNKLYLTGGPMATEDGSMTILAGGTFGGGSFSKSHPCLSTDRAPRSSILLFPSVNWSASLRTPKWVRQKWADEFKLPFFATDGFTRSLEAVSSSLAPVRSSRRPADLPASRQVCSRMGVSGDSLEHNFANRTLLETCEKLGHHGAVIPVRRLVQSAEDAGES